MNENIAEYVKPLVLCVIFAVGSYSLSNFSKHKEGRQSIQVIPKGISNQPNQGNITNHNSKLHNNAITGVLNADGVFSECDKVCVRVPATSANMGPGFDVIGMAVDIWNQYTIEISDKFEIICEGEGEYDIPYDETNLVCVGVKLIFERAGKVIPLLKYHLLNSIPYARGLGSSSAAIVGGLIAGICLTGCDVGIEELMNMATKIEAHPDNIAPAIYGGIRLSLFTSSRWITEKVHLPTGLRCVCFIPDKKGETSAARGVLKEKISMSEAVFNMSRIAWLVNALATNNLDQLSHGVEDALHQPQRAASVYPHLMPIITAAVEAGAIAAYLSGAGPTVMALTAGNPKNEETIDKKVAAAMMVKGAACASAGKSIKILPSTMGAYIVFANTNSVLQ